jgi:hypothetical protein
VSAGGRVVARRSIAVIVTDSVSWRPRSRTDSLATSPSLVRNSREYVSAGRSPTVKLPPDASTCRVRRANSPRTEMIPLTPAPSSSRIVPRMVWKP